MAMRLDGFRRLLSHATLAAVALCSGTSAAQGPEDPSGAAAEASAAPPGITASAHPTALPQGTTPAPEPAPASPAPTPPQSSGGAKNSDWHVLWHPLYLWGSSLSGTAGAGGLTTEVDAGFGEILDEVNFVYATALDVRKNRVGVLMELNYMNLGDSKTYAAPSPFSGAQLSAKLFYLDPEVYYRVKESDRGSFDVMAGFRYWHLDNKITFLPGLLPGTTVSAQDNWVDPVFGARVRLNLDQDKKWYLPIKGDVGGFGAGSDLTWQIFAGAGRNFGKRYTLLLGWRALSVNRQNAPKVFDLTLHGPVMSFGINFK